MATTTITALTGGTALGGTEVAPFDQGASTVKITANQIKTWAVAPTYITDATTARTLSATDNGAVIYFTSGSAITLSMAGSLGAFACTVLQGGAGQITFAANSQTMTVAGSLTKTAYVGATALVLGPASGTFLISGTLA